MMCFNIKHLLVQLALHHSAAIFYYLDNNLVSSSYSVLKCSNNEATNKRNVAIKLACCMLGEKV